MTSLLAPLLESDRSSTTSLLPLHIAVHIVFLLLISYAEWLIPIPPFSLGGSTKHTTSALRSTLVSSAAMVHSSDPAQFCLITLIIGGQSSCFGISHSRSRDLGLSHHDMSRLPRRLLFLRISLLLPSAICCPSSIRSLAKHHTIRPRCRVRSFVEGSPSCSSRLSARPRHSGGFALFRAPGTERNMISSAIGALLQRVDAKGSLLRCTPHCIALVVACPVIA